MNSCERAFFAGRLQPPHQGHLDVFDQMDQAEDIGELIIGIGSSQYHHMRNNPFTFEEREEMVRKSLNINKPYQIISIPDIHSNAGWVDHVVNLAPPFGTVYTGNTLVRELFTDKGYRVREAVRHHQVCASDIRHQMILGGDWQKFLPEGTLEVLAKIKGVDRLREIYYKYLYPAITTDLIINYCNEGVVLIQRQDSAPVYGGWWAIPGGFLELDKESLEEASVRETREETGLIIDPLRIKLFGVYSRPNRDPRQHTVSVVFETFVEGGKLRAGDDAQNIGVFPFNTLPTLAFDHNQIMEDYRRSKEILL